MTKHGKDNTETERLFTAIRLPGHLQEQVYVWRNDIKRRLSFRKWTDPRDYHITLQFMGDVDMNTIPLVTEALKEAAVKCGAFELYLGAPGAFGKPSSPRVLWRGVEGEMGRLHRLQKTVVEHMIPLGFSPEERPYSPHITVARSYTGAEPAQPLTEGEDAGNQAVWKVTDFVLFATRLGHHPMYKVLQTFPLPTSWP
ncbi:RNA 2',3'-cyclic phosphodiesterase [Paenibacillus sp. P96]|uniref:RNA 2',3'-cyclic phosphodiesterase n=1 Tax=Paenibacillus zeirhizosphaerae TaxID=2987519 RepID=A0ABT9FWU7_9BACL|nr:RNA 2',3'-cyclic phosphodiesterase [Paenibacillus sp. P96]MDP4098967.1 RNA 2',3'-cyclic phosphodiesterase [Paenibacillus sp. P96]